MAQSSPTGAAAPTSFNFVSAAHLLHAQAHGGLGTPAQAQARSNHSQLSGHIDCVSHMADDMARMSEGIDLLLCALEYSAPALGLDTRHTLALRGLLGPISQQLSGHAATLAATVATTDSL